MVFFTFLYMFHKPTLFFSEFNLWSCGCPLKPLISIMFAKADRLGLDPMKIVGITTLDVVRANKSLGLIGLIGFS